MLRTLTVDGRVADQAFADAADWRLRMLGERREESAEITVAAGGGVEVSFLSGVSDTPAIIHADVPAAVPVVITTATDPRATRAGDRAVLPGAGRRADSAHRGRAFRCAPRGGPARGHARSRPRGALHRGGGDRIPLPRVARSGCATVDHPRPRATWARRVACPHHGRARSGSRRTGAEGSLAGGTRAGEDGADRPVRPGWSNSSPADSASVSPWRAPWSPLPH